MSPVDRFFNVLMWMIVGAIAFIVLVRGGSNSVALADTGAKGFLGGLSIITGQKTSFS